MSGKLGQDADERHSVSCKDKSSTDPVLSTNRCVYNECDFVQIQIRGDGHCMVSSVLQGLKQQSRFTPSKEQVLMQIRPTFLKKIDHYSLSLEGSTDPVAEINEYVQLRNYQSSITDIIFPILCDILKIKITVLEHNISEKTFELKSDIHVYTPSTDSDNIVHCVYVVKKGGHYDALWISRNSSVKTPRRTVRFDETDLGNGEGMQM